MDIAKRKTIEQSIVRTQSRLAELDNKLARLEDRRSDERIKKNLLKDMAHEEKTYCDLRALLSQRIELDKLAKGGGHALVFSQA